MIYTKSSDYVKMNIEKPIWACAFAFDTSKETFKCFCKPIEGMIVGRDHEYFFVPFKKDGNLSKTGIVKIDSRNYADTYDECVDLYNSLIENNIHHMEKLIEETKKQFIKRT